MKKIAVLFILFFSGFPSIFAQSASPFTYMENDFSRLMLYVGREVLPQVQQNDIAGSGMGPATFGDAHFYLSLTTGAIVTDGVLKFRDDSDAFTILDIKKLLSDNAPSSGTAKTLYDKSYTMAPFPTAKIAFGFILPWDFDFQGSGFILPESVISNVSGLSIDAMNLVFRLRHPLIKEDDNFPAISLGIGYSYSDVNIKYNLSNFTQDYSGQTLNFNGHLKVSTLVNSFGTDLTISKRFFFFTPFLTTSLWYEAASYKASGDLTATLSADGTSSSYNLNPKATYYINSFAPIFTGGWDTNLFLFHLQISGSYDLSTKYYGAQATVRFQF